jgi:hypothetical protein
MPTKWADLFYDDSIDADLNETIQISNDKDSSVFQRVDIKNRLAIIKSIFYYF